MGPKSVVTVPGRTGSRDGDMAVETVHAALAASHEQDKEQRRLTEPCGRRRPAGPDRRAVRPAHEL